MANPIVSGIFAVLDPLITLLASLSSRLIDYRTRLAAPASSQKQADAVTHSLSALFPCRYRLDPSPPLTLSLSPSRKLSYAIFGSTSPTAHTVFFLHGWPGSRMEGTFLDAAAQRHNVRLVALDRPGFGASTPDPRRTILSHARDIQHAAHHLGAERYGVLGVSGGGPYALACAAALPAEKLLVVSVVCGLGPADIEYWGMFPVNYLGWTLAAHHLPLLTRWWFSREPAGRLDLGVRERLARHQAGFERARSGIPEKDVRILGDRDVKKAQISVAAAVHAQGSEWWQRDMTLLASDPGFRVENIRRDLVVLLRYGRLDGNVPLRHGEEVARRLWSGRGEGDAEVRLRVMQRLGCGLWRMRRTQVRCSNIGRRCWGRWWKS